MNLAASAALQARSIYALILRRIRSEYAGSRAGYAWALIEPIVWVFVLKTAIKSSASGQPPLGTSYEVFFATGIVLARMWRTSTGKITQILIRAKRERLPTLHRLDAAYATWLLEMMTGGVALIMMLCILQIFGFDAVPGNLLMCIIAFVACAIFTLAFAFGLALVLVLAPGLEHFRGIILIIVFFTSGFQFVVDRMPPNLRAVVVWNPLLHVIEWFREGFYRGYESRSLDLVYLFGVCVVLLLLGLVGERAFRRKSNQESPIAEDNIDV